MPNDRISTNHHTPDPTPPARMEIFAMDLDTPLLKLVIQRSDGKFTSCILGWCSNWGIREYIHAALPRLTFEGPDWNLPVPVRIVDRNPAPGISFIPEATL